MTSFMQKSAAIWWVRTLRLPNTYAAVSASSWWIIYSYLLIFEKRSDLCGVFSVSIYLFTISYYSQLFCRSLCFAAKTIRCIAKESEEENRKCPARNTTVQLSTAYTDSERHNAQRHRQTDGRTSSRQEPIIPRAVRSAKNLCGYAHA